MKATHALSLLNTLLDFFLVKTEQQTQVFKLSLIFILCMIILFL